MAKQDLTTLVRSLSPGALRLYKQQLSALSERDKKVAFSRLSGIEELADIIGRQPSTSAQKPVRERPEPQTIQQEVPLWQKALSTANAPFDWVSRNITEPFGAFVTDPWTPSVAGTERLPWYERQRAEYKAWDDPNLGFLGVKGIVETLPWLALPTAGGVLGKLGGIAAKGGALGKAAGYGAAALKPVAAAEQAVNPFAWQRGIESFAAKRAGGKLVGKAVGEVTPKVTKIITRTTKQQDIQETAKILEYKLKERGIPEQDIPDLLDVYNISRTATEIRASLTFEQLRRLADVDITESNIRKLTRIILGKELNVPAHEVDLVLGGGVRANPRLDVQKARVKATEIDEFVKANLPTHKDILASLSKALPKAKAIPGKVIGAGLGKIIPKKVAPEFDVKLARIAEKLGRLEKLTPEEKELSLSSPQAISDAGVAFRRAKRAEITPSGVPLTKTVWRAETGLPSERVSKSYALVEEMAEPEFMVGKSKPEFKVTKSEITLQRPLVIKGLQGDLLDVWVREGDKEAARLIAIAEEAGKARTAFQEVMGIDKVPPGWYQEVDNYIAKKVGSLGYDGIYYDAGERAEIAVIDKALLGKIIPKMGKVPSAVWADPVKYRIVSEMFPDGMGEKQTDAVVAILDLVKQSKPITKSILAMRKPEQAARAAEMGRLRQQYIEQGMPAREAGNRAMAALESPYPTKAMTPEFKKLLADLGDKENTLFQMLNEAPFKSEFDWLNTHTALQDLLLENPLQRNQIARLEKAFGSELAKALLEKRGKWEKAKEFLLELGNAPRALLASGDASYLLRQGAMGLAGYPKVGIKTFAPSIKATFSDKFAGELDSIIRSQPHTEIMIEHGLAITPLPGRGLATSLVEREEPFISGLFGKLGEHIPALKKVNFVTASNRGYVSGLNNLRSSISEQVLNIAEATGRKVTDLDLDELAGFVNAITGRGDLHFEALKRADSLLNAIFFAPKLVASRIQVFKYLWSPSEVARREAWRTLPRFFGTGIAMLTAAKLSGAAEVELDLRSADFGKLKVGDNRLDIWTGYSQYARFLAQLALAQRKTEGGRTVRLNRKDVILRFGQTKLSPAAGLLADLATGETYLGEDFPPKSAKSLGGQLWERFAPLALQDIIQGVEADGFIGGFRTSPGLLGVGVAVYTDEVKRARDRAAQKEFGMSWDEVGTKYGRATQLKLEQTPSIIEAEKEHEDRFAGGTPTSMDNFRNEGKLIEETYREGVDNAVREYRVKKDGKLFREKVNKVSENRRAAYSLRAKKDEYTDIIAYYNQPLPPDKLAEMNPGDVLRREFYQQMFDPIKMYDEFGNYRFEEADKIEQKFVVKYGQQAMDYIEEYQGARWQDKPVELKMLEEAKELLRPYWDITDKVWAMYPEGLQEISDQIQVMENGTDEQQRLAKVQLRKYPMILRARELIVRYKQRMRQYNPAINQAYKLFY